MADSIKQVSESKSQNFFSLINEGGSVMVVMMTLLTILTGIGIFVFVERLMAIRKASKMDDNFMSIIRDHIVTGNITAARSMAKNTSNAVAKVIDKGIQRIGKPIDAIEKSMESVANRELYKMERNVSTLSVIGYIAPLFGFLGTIIGMFQLFRSIANTGEYSITTIAGGIYIKMISSAAGLIIGLCAYIAFRVLNTQIEKAANKLEVAGAEFVDILQEPTR